LAGGVLTRDGQGVKAPKGAVMSNVKGKTNDFKDKANATIDAAADAAKRATDAVVDKSKEAAHMAGKKLEKEGKRLQGM
jgi:hypothetical protein